MENGEESRGGKFDDIFNFRPGEFGSRETTEDLTASLQEIQKMDAVLRIKVTEEKRAKLSRIQAEEESRDILSKLPSTGMPDRIKINVEKFMKLLNEVEKVETDMAPRLKPNEEEEMTQEEPNPDEEAEKEGKTVRRRQNANSLAFVERNIRLAKCGRGTLSLTDEEKSRIDNLLADIDDSNSNAKTTEKTFENESYAMDKQTKSILSEIDRRLELLTKSKTTKRIKEATMPFEKSNPEEKPEEKEKENGSREKKDKKKSDRLEEINKLLNSMNLKSEEEIRPLSEEEIGSLVRLSKDSLTREDREKGGGPPSNVMTDLVSDAKLLMPKFKYRFDDA